MGIRKLDFSLLKILLFLLLVQMDKILLVLLLFGFFQLS